MSNKSQIYLAGLAMYVVASLAGFIIESYWLITLASLLIAGFTAFKVFKQDKEELYEATRVDWISIFAFAAVECVLGVCIWLLKMPLVGLVGYLNLFTQIMGYIFVGYAVVRYTLTNTTVYKEVTKKFTSKRENTIISDEEPTNTKVAEEVTEIIKEETPEYHDVEVVGTKTETEIKSIELKVEEETEIATPYMEEEI